jgi:hypothetical protein
MTWNILARANDASPYFAAPIEEISINQTRRATGIAKTGTGTVSNSLDPDVSEDEHQGGKNQ